MTTSIGPTGLSTGGVITTKPVVVPASSTDAAFQLPKNPTERTGPSAVTVDAGTGTVITEFLNNNGQVQSQFPSSVAVAYLRAGLTADGRSRQQQEAHSV